MMKGDKMIKVQTPVRDDCIEKLKIGDQIEISGIIYTGRDAVLPKLVKLSQEELEKMKVNFKGGVIFHTAVSPAGIGPTSSNKLEIEESIGPLSVRGIKIYIGKGALNKETISILKENNAIFAITPPVTALLTVKIISKEVAMFPEEGIEALHRLKVSALPAIVAIAHGKSIFEESGEKSNGS
jgi:fumarate hydratase subunit beta